MGCTAWVFEKLEVTFFLNKERIRGNHISCLPLHNSYNLYLERVLANAVKRKKSIFFNFHRLFQI